MVDHWIDESNYNASDSTKKEGAVMHWMVGTERSAYNRFSDPGENASAHYGIDTDGALYRYVHDRHVAWHAGDREANRKYIGIEHAGGWLVGEKTRVKPTASAHRKSAELLAYLANKHGWGPLEVGKNVFPHREFNATECPGTLNVEKIIENANKLREAHNQNTMTEAKTLTYGEIIAEAYRGVLGREPDAEGLEMYRNRAEKGKMSLAEVMDELVQSSEFRKKRLNVNVT